MRRIAWSLSLVVLLGSLGFGGYYGLFLSDHFLLEQVDIVTEDKALSPLLKSQVEKSLKEAVSGYKGQSVWSLSLSAVSGELSALPWVENVTLERRLPSRLVVRYDFKKVALVYVNHRGHFYPITWQGDLLSKVPVDWVPDCPFVRSSLIFKNEVFRKKLLSLYSQLPKDGWLSQSTVAEVKWETKKGLSLELTHTAGDIVLGHELLRQRVSRVQNVLSYLKAQSKSWRVIDASFSKKVLVRLRNHS